MLSLACEYGIKAVICLAITSTEGKRNRLASVAKNINSPEAYTSKILQQLVNANIVTSVKGKAGGFYISTEQLESLTIWDVVSIIDGDKLQKRCLVGLAECSSSKPCPLHDHYKSIRSDLITFLQSEKIERLANKVTIGEGFLNHELSIINQNKNFSNEKSINTRRNSDDLVSDV